MIVVIDYGINNMCSIEKSLKKINAEYFVSSSVEDIALASHIIIPGIGFFKEGMKNLRDLGLSEEISFQAIKMKKYVLGICLGMQLLLNKSEEGDETHGMGLVDGEVKRFFQEATGPKVPHIGWNSVSYGTSEVPVLFNGIKNGSEFYFLHSYHAILHEDVTNCVTEHGYQFVSAFQKDNIFGVQFHPEKSQSNGLALLKNFSALRYDTKN